MAAWVTVYMNKRMRLAGASAIKRRMPMPDWWTLGEEVGVEEEDVDAFLASLTWSDEPFEIRAKGERRPLQLHVWTSAERVREEVAELGDDVPASVKRHLERTKMIVAIEMGFSQLETMFEVVAYEVAYWLAEQGEGVIRGANDAWFDHDAHRWDPITA